MKDEKEYLVIDLKFLDAKAVPAGMVTTDSAGPNSTQPPSRITTTGTDNPRENEDTSKGFFTILFIICGIVLFMLGIFFN